MAFEKGISGNPDGRPRGAVNRTSSQLREMIAGFLETNFDRVQADFLELKPRDRVKLYCDLLQYGLPRLQAVQLETDIERLPDDQIDELYQRIIENQNSYTNGQ